VYFHGPAYRVLETAWPEHDRATGLLAGDLPAELGRPEKRTVAGPRLVELAFQTAGIWDLGLRGRFGLPQRVDRIRFGPLADPQGQVQAVVTPRAGEEAFDAEILDESGAVLVSVEGYRTVDFPAEVDATALRPLQVTEV
jgi:hypothetical protein